MQGSRCTLAVVVAFALLFAVATTYAQDKADKPATAKPQQDKGKVKQDDPAAARPEAGQAKEKAKEDETAAGPNWPKCPVMKQPVDLSVKTMTPDGPVYFCCSGCIPQYTADPGKYAKGVAAQRQAFKKLPRVQVTCPVSGETVDPKMSIEQDGQKVYFCCKDCIGKFQKEPAKYKGKLEASYTYQTRCPVTGEKIDPAAYTDLATGQRIHWCCPACEKKLLQDPAKYAPQLAEQGVKIDVKKLEVSKSASDKGKAARGAEDEKGKHEHP
jgi:YHS domain-containing protein